MSTSKGHIKLYRSIEDWEWSDDPVMFYAWVRILMLANWEDKRWHNEIIKRGSFATSLSHLAGKLNLGVQRVRTILQRLEECEQVVLDVTNKRTIVTICNYDIYQGDESNEQHANSHDNQQTTNKQLTTTKEENISISNDISYSPKETKNIDSYESWSTSEIVDLWNSIVVNCPKVTKLSTARRQKVYSRIKEMGGKEKAKEIITTCFQKLNNSSFCTGHNDRGWKADFDWFFTNGNNWVKVYEGKYDNKDGKTINSVRNSIVDYPDGTYSLKDFNSECLSQITQYGIEFRRALQRGGSIKKVNGRWVL